MNVVLGECELSILEGYPPGVNHGMLIPLYAIRGKVWDPEPIVAWYQAALLEIPAVIQTGKGLRCTVPQLDEAAERQLHEVLAGMVQRIRESRLSE